MTFERLLHPRSMKYAKLSPLLDVGQVETATIFLGGRKDWNVPVLNAELFYQSLKHKGVPTRLVVYPNSHHGAGIRISIKTTIPELSIGLINMQKTLRSNEQPGNSNTCWWRKT
jgi:hypothetical protein